MSSPMIPLKRACLVNEKIDQRVSTYAKEAKAPRSEIAASHPQKRLPDRLPPEVQRSIVSIDETASKRNKWASSGFFALG